MQRNTVTIEEQLILKAIKEECPWENLPKRLQSTLATKEEWHRRIIEHCIKKRLQWNTCFARRVCKEGEYYEDMMRYLRKNLALFPYHLAEYVCRVMRVSPFRYYCDIIFEVMKNEQPYDSIPNFSAADALRLTGIGRNEFIDIMNKCRSKKIMWKLNKSIAKELLPTKPVDFAIEPWWGVCLVNFTLEEFKKLTDEETATIDKICKEEANAFVLFDPEIIKGLYQRGLVYFDVPVYPDDRFKVSRLEGFVSNREQLYEDPIEELLYAVFVVSNENTTVAELATTLQADLSQLQAAASFACRLGWAVKIIDPGSIFEDTLLPDSPKTSLIDEEDATANLKSSSLFTDGDASQQGDFSGTENIVPRSGHTRVAFVVDANITSYLMMGSVSPGLKSHAVTLYEAGKLGHASISDLCKDLGTLEGAKFEGELQEFANHASSLRCVLECLLSGGVAANDKVEELSNRMRLLASSEDVTSSIASTTSIDQPRDAGLDETEVSADNSTKEGCASQIASIDAYASASLYEASNPSNEITMLDSNAKSDEVSIPVEGSDVGGGTLRKHRKYRVDILRCESLATLAPETLVRLFLRDYDIVMSIIPLPHSSVLPGPRGPMHFGPPSHSSLTPWMKLVLYSTLASGPLSVVLMKGQSLRFLPAPLAGSEKALIWSWDGSTVGGLGGKFEGNLVNGRILLHCLNSLLKYSAVLVQPFTRNDLDASGKIITLDIPLPLNNTDGSVTYKGDGLGFSEAESAKLNSQLTNLVNKIELPSIGYIRLLKLYNESKSDLFAPEEQKYEWVPLSVEFGMPLFSPNLCNSICKRVVASGLLQSDTLNEHHDAMHGLRKRLRDMCAEYQATGPVAKLLYQKEQVKGTSQKLMNYASGKWNPQVDPSSPISEATSENQRLKLANRQRCKTEVLSFDGSILRSYAIDPAHEAATIHDQDASSTNTSKVDPDEADSREVVLPGVNLIFDGSELHPFEISACLQARQPVALIADAALYAASVATK